MSIRHFLRSVGPRKSQKSQNADLLPSLSGSQERPGVGLSSGHNVAASTAQNLPFELLKRVFLTLQGRSSAELARLTLVCRSWHIPAIEVLYISVKPLTLTGVLKMLRTLKLHPEYVHRVKSLLIPTLGILWIPLSANLRWMLPPEIPVAGKSKAKTKTSRQLGLHLTRTGRTNRKAEKREDGWTLYSALICFLPELKELKFAYDATHMEDLPVAFLLPAQPYRSRHISSLHFCGSDQFANVPAGRLTYPPCQIVFGLFIGLNFQYVTTLTICHVKLGPQFFTIGTPAGGTRLRRLIVQHCDLNTTGLLVATFSRAATLRTMQLLNVDTSPLAPRDYDWNFEMLPPESCKALVHVVIDARIFKQIMLRLDGRAIRTVQIRFEDINLSCRDYNAAERYIGEIRLPATTVVSIVRKQPCIISSATYNEMEMETLLALAKHCQGISPAISTFHFSWTILPQSCHFWDGFLVKLSNISNNGILKTLQLKKCDHQDLRFCTGTSWKNPHANPVSKPTALLPRILLFPFSKKRLLQYAVNHIGA